MNCSEKPWLVAFLHSECAGFIMSKVLGILVSVGALGYKTPVIANIIRRKSADGLSIWAVYLESSGYMSWTCYNALRSNSVTSYGDLVINVAQNFIIIALIWIWGISKKDLPLMTKLAFVGIVAAFLGCVFVLPPHFYYLFAVYGTAMTFVSKVPQIVSNYVQRGVGVQSPITFMISVFGASAKCFISLMELKDPVLFLSSLASVALSSVLLFQVFLYKNETEVEKKKTS